MLGIRGISTRARQHPALRSLGSEQAASFMSQRPFCLQTLELSPLRHFIRRASSSSAASRSLADPIRDRKQRPTCI